MDIIDILFSFHNNDNKLFHKLKEFFLTKDKLTARSLDLRVRFKGKVSLLFDTRELIKIIDRPGLIIVLLSKNYLKDKWLVEELRAFYAIEQYTKKSFILPILIGDIQDSEIPSYFNEKSITIIDYRNEQDKEYKHLISSIDALVKPEKKIFIGHGRSYDWIALKDFLQEEHLQWEEFNSIPTAGIAVKERLDEMLNNTQFAFLIMTAEDEHSDGTQHARENVIHEVGLFQGKLGFKRAIILLEEGCEVPSNASGLVYISFPPKKIKACFQEVRDVLKREEIIIK